jgi:uncharacterized LabA/DUF88 family protein
MPQINLCGLFFAPMALICKRESIVLIDGYNLYHSLREIEKDHGHRVRWLDVRKLSERLLNRLFPPTCPYPHVFFFTAYSTHKSAAHVERQKEYHQCLKRLGVTVVTDGFWTKKDVDLKHHFRDAPWFLRKYLVRRFRTLETPMEKGTDVSLAAHLMHLGAQAKWACVVSGDADLLPALELFQEVNPTVKLGLARPYKRETRMLNIKNCTNISPDDCLACLLPNPAPTKKRMINKPPHW